MKNKKLLLLFLVILISFVLLNNKSFASENTLTFKHNEEEITLQNFTFSNNPYAIISGDGSIRVFVYEGTIEEGYIYCPYIYYTGSRWELSFCSYSNDNDEISVKDSKLVFNIYTYDTENYTYTISYTGNWCSFSGGTEGVYYASPMCFIANGLGNVSSDNIKDNVFFQVAPLLQGVQVVEIAQVEEIPKAIAQTMKTIIPVGLVGLSIFLVIYLTKSVISRQM